MNDPSDTDRLARGLTLVGVSLAGVNAIAPLDLPAATLEYAALTALMIAAYGLFMAASTNLTVDTLKRIVPEQYH